MARMCFSCCTTCATSEIDFERTIRPDPADWYGYNEWAYTYFHEQDALALGAEAPSVLLGFSAFRAYAGLQDDLVEASYKGDANAEREVSMRTDRFVAERIVAVGTDNGLDMSWSDDVRAKVGVAAPEWRKPLPGRE